MHLLRTLFILLLSYLPTAAQVAVWDLPPLRYSSTPASDRVAKLAESWQKDPALVKGDTPLERVRFILAELEVPESSQILVFSKTSKQNSLIHPDNPRALYFSNNVYLGYVPGGALEVIIQDARPGPVFYVIALGDVSQPIRVTRDTNDCLSCHGTSRTKDVPGLLVRSVFPSASGLPLFAMGSELVTHQTAIQKRWGGYYVTGSVSLPHLGNQTYVEGEEAIPEKYNWQSLEHRISTVKYPRATSDIVALMVLEHQCHAHNLLTAASMNYRRASYLIKAIHPSADADAGAAGQIAERAAREIIDWFLFRGEAGQGADGVEGNEVFQRDFEAAIPHTADGHSLAEFHLNGRIFKHRCSYMIYSEAFRELPIPIKSRVIARLKNIMGADNAADEYPAIKLPERRRISKILHETAVW